MPSPMRSWAEFFDFANFGVPPTELSELKSRIHVNVSYYETNYLILVAISMVAVIFKHWTFLLGLVLVAATAYALFGRGLPAPSVTIGGRQFRRSELIVSFLIVTLILFTITGGIMFLLCLSLSSLVVLVHSAFRQRSLKAKATNYWSLLKREWSSKDEDDVANDPELGVRPANTSNVDPALRDDAAKFRSQFRSQMRAKYLQK